MIVKKIHYCWFGNTEKNATIINCIKSWKEHLPDYEVIEWNESNSDLDSQFCKQALYYKKWAFLSDYVRLKVLYEWGGIYMDTDMLVIKSFEPLLSQNCFLGYQDNGQINASIIGCIPKNPFIKACLDKYNQLQFDEKRLMAMAIPEIITKVYENFADKMTVNIYPSEYFYPYPFADSLKGKNYLDCINSNTYAIHLWNASWFTEKELAGFAFESGNYLKGFKLFLHYLIKNPGAIAYLPSIIARKLITRRGR